jgi:hypothetical protein
VIDGLPGTQSGFVGASFWLVNTYITAEIVPSSETRVTSRSVAAIDVSIPAGAPLAEPVPKELMGPARLEG